MKKIIGSVIIFILLFPAFSVFIPQVKAQTWQTIFSDDFESYAVGTFPSAGGWILVYDGRGAEYQIVVDTVSYSGQKSLQLWGQDWWSARVWKGFSTAENVIGYEQSILISGRNIPTGTPFDHTGFYNKDIAPWGRGWASVQFFHTDLKIRAEDGTVLGDWTPGTWYRVRVVLDRTAKKYSVWINGELRGSGLGLVNQDTENINGIGLTSDHPGVKVYHDDVEVFEMPPPPTKWAVIIGVNEYSDPVNNMWGPTKSARDMYNLLVNDFNFPSENVHLKTDEIGVSDDDVTGDLLRTELDWLQTNARQEDTIVFYYAGHGYRSPTGEPEYLQTHDEFISDDTLATEINGIKSQKFVVILDISYAGGFIRDGGLSDLALDANGDRANGRIILTSCGEVRHIWEDTRNTDYILWLPETEMLFTHYLVEGFKGAGDRNGDRKVTVEEAFNYGSRKVREAKLLVAFPLNIRPDIYDGYPTFKGPNAELYLGT